MQESLPMGRVGLLAQLLCSHSEANAGSTICGRQKGGHVVWSTSVLPLFLQEDAKNLDTDPKMKAEGNLSWG
jgi:hypothetical protein